MARDRLSPRVFTVEKSSFKSTLCDILLEKGKNAGSPIDNLCRVLALPPLNEPPLLNRVSVPIAKVFPNNGEALLDLIDFMVEKWGSFGPWHCATCPLASIQIAGKLNVWDIVVNNVHRAAYATVGPIQP
jgi:hypothetical protein